MSPKITQKIIDKVIDHLEEGKDTKYIKGYIARETFLGKTQVNQAYNDIMGMLATDLELSDFEELEDPAIEKIPVEQAKATFNEKTGVAESTGRIKTLEELLEACQVDREIWTTKSFVCNSWESTSRNEEGERVPITLFQVKANLEKKVEQERVKKALAFYRSELDKEKAAPKIITKYKKGNCLLEISPPDVHIGQLSYGEETGHGNYDSKIAAHSYINAVMEILQDAILSKEIDRIVFPIGNDFFNCDNSKSMTTAGTFQVEDSRWQKTFQLGCRLLVDVLDVLIQVAPVDCIIVPGNHDIERNFYLGCYLESWYRNNKQVTFNNSPNRRKYYRYFNNLTLFTHGKEEKHADLPLLMAQEAAADWGVTKFREAHLGHFHQEKVVEFKGVKVRVVPSLAASDDWHSAKGYVGNLKQSQGFIYHKEEGLKQILYSTPVTYNNL